MKSDVCATRGKRKRADHSLVPDSPLKIVRGGAALVPYPLGRTRLPQEQYSRNQ